MADKLGVAVIGCGYWGVNYVRLFHELPDANLIAVCEMDASRRDQIANRFPEARLCASLDEICALEGIDAVVVATPATTHYEVARQCLEAGKHVLVEKPLATTSREVEALHQLAEARHLKLMVGHIFQYNAGVQLVRQTIQEGHIGRIYYLDSQRTNLGPFRSDVNVIWDLATHDVSIFNHLLQSSPEWVSAVGSRVLRENCCEDVAFLVLSYPGNILGHIHVSWANPNKEREISVIGSEGRIVFNDLNTLEPVRIFEKSVSMVKNEPSSFGEYKFAIRDGAIISPKVPISEPLRNQCLHFIECIQHDLTPITDALSGLHVVRVMEAADRSIELNGMPVALNYERENGDQPVLESSSIR